MSYFFRKLFHLQKFDPTQPRGKTTPESNSGSFAPRAAGDKGAPGPSGQGGFTNFIPAVGEALGKVRDTIARWAGAAVGVARQPGVATKDALIAAATAALPVYESMMRTVASLMDGSMVIGNQQIMVLAENIKNGTQIERPMVLVADIKGGPRLDEKIATDYNGDPSQVKDMVRGTVLVPGASTLDDALEALEKAGVRLATPPKDRINEPGPDGYRDIKLNAVLPNGHISEIQVMTPEIFVAKMLKAHEYYGSIRKLVTDLEKTGRQPTPDEAKLIQRVVDTQRVELYGPAWEKDLQV
jgi:hypothetical protein